MDVGFDRGLKASGGLPLMAQILVSDVCNHACEHCYQVHGRKGEMTFAEVEALLDELAQLGMLFVSFSGGEATLRPDLPDLLRAARRRGFAIVLQTNGYAISEELLETLAEVGVWRVRISVYSDVADEHDAVTRVAGSFERTTDSIRRLRARGIPVDMVVSLTSYCSAPVERIEALAASLGCDVYVTSALSAKEDGSLASLSVEPTREQNARYFRAEGLRGEPVPARASKLGEPPCAACSSSITIHANGSVRPCTHIPLELGRVDGAGAGAVRALQHDEGFRFLAGITWREVHGCRDCALLSWCSRCHGSASFETGDLLGPQPSACARAIIRYESHVGPLERLTAIDPELSARPPDVGPFELTDAGGLRPIRDAVSSADEALARRFSWIRPTRAHIEQMAGIVPTDRLVRRRRDDGAALSCPSKEKVDA